MKNYATLRGFERINGSINGNPNYRVILELGDGTFETRRSSSDRAWCYSLGNNWIDKTVTYTLTRSGRIDTMNITTLEDTFVDPLLSTRGEK